MEAKPVPPIKFTHGTYYGYQVAGCRCDPCGKIAKDARTRYHARNLAASHEGKDRLTATLNPS